jgi:hypothetical protein
MRELAAAGYSRCSPRSIPAPGTRYLPRTEDGSSRLAKDANRAHARVRAPRDSVPMPSSRPGRSCVVALPPWRAGQLAKATHGLQTRASPPKCGPVTQGQDGGNIDKTMDSARTDVAYPDRGIARHSLRAVSLLIPNSADWCRT